MSILINKFAGTFAENKDAARELRIKKIMPVLEQNKEVILDFEGVTGATQSFVHALISDAIRRHSEDALDLMIFKNCNPTVKEVITLVTEYMQEG